MELNSWPGFFAVILALISFYGMTYLVVALNLGWRFGYWVCGACFGALMVMLSLFWAINVRPDQAVGPQGALPRWNAIAAGEEIRTAEFGGKQISAVASYPGGAWEQSEAGDPQAEAFSSAVQNCLSTDPESLPEEERDACAAAQELMPPEEDVPVILGTPVVVVPKITDVRFSEDTGVLAQAVVSPLTTDPRVTKDPNGEQLAEPFRIVAILDKGSVGLPSYMSLVVFIIFTLFHLRGLDRAEKRKLNPASV
jgi:hypothetical protein